MLITTDMAQPIVDRLVEVMDDPVSIIDHEGIVAASSDPSRIGSYHAGAARAMREGKDLFVYSIQAEKLSGTRMGITMPLQFHGECVGAVGITGDPDALKAAAALIHVAVISLIEQAHMAQQASYRRKILDVWVANLIAETAGDLDHLRAQAGFLNIDLKKRCSMMVIHTRPVVYDASSMHEEYIYAIVSSHVKVHFYAYVGQGQYVFALRAQSKEDVARLAPLCEAILARLGALNRQSFIGLGKPASDLTGYRQSYLDAAHSVRILTRLDSDKRIIYYYEQQIFRLLESVPAYVLQNFLDSYLEGRTLDPLLRETLEVYFELDKGVAETAEALHIHRNTLAFRLGKVRDLYGLDPRAFRDSVALQLMLYMLRFPEE